MRSKIVIFLVKVCLLYLLWFVLNELIRDTRFWQAFNSLFLREVLFTSKAILKFLGNIYGFTVLSLASNGIKWAPHDTIILYIGEINYLNYREVFISNRCLALDLMWTYCVFIIAFFGPWKKKLWYIPFGIFVINFLNILRVVGLALTTIYFPKYLNFNHHILFTYIVYLFTFIMWVIWVRRYAKDELIRIVEEMKDKK